MRSKLRRLTDSQNVGCLISVRKKDFEGTIMILFQNVKQNFISETAQTTILLEFAVRKRSSFGATDLRSGHHFEVGPTAGHS